jgi:hypothetical protein
MILEVYLHYFVGKTEHYSMSSTHPFLDIDNILDFSLWELFGFYRWFTSFGLFTSLEITSEVLEQSDFLL